MTGDTDPKALEVWSSADGMTWRQVTRDPVILPPLTLVLGFTASRAGVALVTDHYGLDIPSGVTWEFSADGALWTPLRGLPGQYRDSGIGGGVLAAAPDGGFVFTGYEEGGPPRPPASSPGSGSEDDFDVARFLTSADGLRWSDQSAVFSDTHVLRGFAAGQNGTAACGNVVTPRDSPELGSGLAFGVLTCWYRKNGSSTWTPTRPPPGLLPDAGVAPLGDQKIVAITAAGPGFIAVGGSFSPAGGTGAIWVSPDGTTWQKVPTAASGAVPFHAGFNGVAVYKDTAIAFEVSDSLANTLPIGRGYLISAPGRPVTATLTTTATPSATASHPATGSPTTSATAGAFSYATVVAAITRQGYTVREGPDRQGSPGPLRAFIATCTGSADGACAVLEFFYQDRYLGFIRDRQLGTGIVAAHDATIVSQDGHGIVVRYVVEKQSDALCCPSGAHFTVTYSWNGMSIVATGASASNAPPLSAKYPL
jgi:hypothetical protein